MDVLGYAENGNLVNRQNDIKYIRNQQLVSGQVTLQVFWSPLECISISILIFQALTLAGEFESQNTYTWEVFEYTCPFENTCELELQSSTSPLAESTSFLSIGSQKSMNDESVVLSQ